MTRLMLSLIALALFAGASQVEAAGRVELSVRVVNEAGDPLGGAAVRGFFFDQQVIKRRTDPGVTGVTDREGRTEISGTEDLYVDVLVKKDGYYKSQRRILVRDRAWLAKQGEFTIRLRRRSDPIAMRAKRAIMIVEGLVAGEPYGYDLFVGDFTAPHGEGVVGDLALAYSRKDGGVFEWSWNFDVKFVNPSDGLIPAVFDPQGSAYQSDYLAPGSGYRRDWSIDKSRSGMNEATTVSREENPGYYLRVRSRVDESGEVKGGYYGKIYGDFPVVTYYLNPDEGDRNVEWDPSKNRFKSLPILERAIQP